MKSRRGGERDGGALTFTPELAAIVENWRGLMDGGEPVGVDNCAQVPKSVERESRDAIGCWWWLSEVWYRVREIVVELRPRLGLGPDLDKVVRGIKF